jgi:predicted DsbA family dithiol-disulfide isomerase
VAQSVKTISIDVVSDVICPWCFLGKRRLDKALASLPDVKAEVAWRPFFLDPTIPPEGIDRRTYLVNKFGEARLASLHAPFEEAIRNEGVPYKFDKITRTPSTLDAHRLIRWSHVTGKQHETAERLFIAYWCEGRDIGDRHVLADLARDVGLDAEDVAAKLAAGTDSDTVLREADQAIRIGVQGVPCFILAQRHGLSGALPAEQLAAAIAGYAAI